MGSETGAPHGQSAVPPAGICRAPAGAEVGICNLCALSLLLLFLLLFLLLLLLLLGGTH